MCQWASLPISISPSNNLTTVGLACRVYCHSDLNVFDKNHKIIPFMAERWPRECHYSVVDMRIFLSHFYSPDDVQSIISGKLALRYAGSNIEALKSIASASKNRSLSEFKEVISPFSDVKAFFK